MVIKTLHESATNALEEIDLALRFNALYNHGQLDILHQADSRLHDFAATLAFLGCHKTTIEFYAVDIHVAQHRERRLATAYPIDCTRHTNSLTDSRLLTNALSVISTFT